MLRIAAFACALLAGTSCKGDRDSPGSSPASEVTAEPAATGSAPITRATLEKLKKRIAPLRPWDESKNLLVETLGEPTAVEGNDHNWYALDGKLCWELRLVRNKDKVAAVRLKGFPKAVQSTYARCKP